MDKCFDRGRGGGISNKRGKFFLACRESPPPTPPLFRPLVGHPDLFFFQIKVIWSAYCNDFEKIEGEYFLSKQHIHSM